MIRIRKIKNLFVTLLFLGSVVLIFSISHAQEVKQFTVKVEKYKFHPNKITVNKGDKVVIKVIAIDKDHGFGIEAYNIDKTLLKGKEITIDFVADKEGEFTIRCTKWCGFKHLFMSGEFIVK